MRPILPSNGDSLISARRDENPTRSNGTSKGSTREAFGVWGSSFCACGSALEGEVSAMVFALVCNASC
jgi:hypothetical protein